MISFRELYQNTVSFLKLHPQSSCEGVKGGFAQSKLTVVMKKLFDEVDMGQDHSSTTVALQAKVG